MVILKETKKEALTENIEKIPLQNFVKVVGRQSVCRANFTSNSGTSEIHAEPPAFCGTYNGAFYLSALGGNLSVYFQLNSIISITRESYDDGVPDIYTISNRDGSVINLTLLKKN